MNHKITFLLLVCFSVLISSCNQSNKKIYTIVPDDAAFIASFSPGKLMEKADAADLNFMKDVLGDKEFNKFLFENPGMSGIDVNAHSCAFVCGSEQKYLGVIMPIKSKKVFEKFLEKMGEEYNVDFTKENAENYTYSKKDGNVLAWNKSLLIHLTQIKGSYNSPIEEKLKELFSLEDENCILSEKDFNSFLGEQKDLNLWLTSNQLGNLGNGGLGMMNIFGAINNNYAHISLEFGNGEIIINSNLRLNPDFKKNFDKFNFIDLAAEKDILKMLPAEDLILAGNLRINPEKMLEIIRLLNTGNNAFLEEFEKESGKKPAEVLNSIQGSLAFSINAITPIKSDNNASDTTECSDKNMPILVAAMQLNDEKIFTDFLKLVMQNKSLEEKQGYYIVHAENTPFFILIKNKIILLSNHEKYITEIINSGKIENNLFSQDISKALIDYPVCVYLNLDRDTYSEKLRNYFNTELDQTFAKGMGNAGASLKSLTLSGSIEKTEVRIELKEKSVNSLHAILKALDK